jgi:hypothetical protein
MLNLLLPLNGKEMNMLVQVKFPFVTHFSDYHEGEYAAVLFKKLTGRKIFYREVGLEDKGYKFVFDVDHIKLDDADSFSRHKEKFIAP